jgi:tyrosine-specific transport protein
MSFFSALQSKNTLGATLLVTGCCIGAGMIGLPVMSALAGFMPSALAMFFCYIFTTLTGLLLLEATLWFDKEVNLLTIAEFAFGKWGKLLALVLFLFLFYCIFVAYLDGGGLLFSKLLSFIFQQPVSRGLGVVFCAFFVGALTFAGTRVVDGLNRGFFAGLVLTYCLLVALGFSQMDPSHLKQADWKAAIGTIPLLLICFGYQNLVPSLTSYLKRKVVALRFAIIVGNFIPFFIYFLWNLVILSLLPADSAQLASQANMITDLLQGGSHYISVLFLVNAFSLFAILTSFLPSALSFVDFLKDGFKASPQSETQRTLLLCALVFVPPLVCALAYPHVFLSALSFAGGFIDVLLFGILPAAVVLVGRYVKKVAGPYQVAGGSVTPAVVLLLSVLFLFIKVH